MRLGMITAAVVVALTAGVASANPGVEARQALMKSMVGNVKAISGYVKGDNAETPADVARRAAAIKADAGKIASAFGDQIHAENADGIKTRATPAIWLKWDEFAGNADKLGKDAGALEMTAAGGDQTAIAAAFGAVAKNCGACHKAFRGKKQ